MVRINLSSIRLRFYSFRSGVRNTIERLKNIRGSRCKYSGLEIVTIRWATVNESFVKRPVFPCPALSSTLRNRAEKLSEKNKRNYEPIVWRHFRPCTAVFNEGEVHPPSPSRIIHPIRINSLRRLTLPSLPPQFNVSTFVAAWKQYNPFAFARSFERLIL